ncbi:HPF/RaiA family ribosome-associated protein [Sandarakinorhabdus sp.]|uniref:HPF/RaiA family ribosome-associated protein n=1 Tax=Sandarakinorhabdus sp. TaxID=1916663 RepID=UPI003F70B545
MQIQINSDNIIKLGDAGSDDVSATVSARLERFADRLTRVEVHFSDINGRENNVGDDKRCMIEARPAGRDPVAVTHEAASLDAALGGALPKLITALERDFGRTTTRKGH